MQLFNGLFCNAAILQPVNFGDFNGCIVINKKMLEQILLVSVIEETYSK